MVKKAVYYGRVSTEEQAVNGYSLDMQKEKCIEWANSHDCEIVKFLRTGANQARTIKNYRACNR